MSEVYFDPAFGGDGSTVSDDANPMTGLRRGGYKTRFVPALSNAVAVAGFIVGKVSEAATSALDAAASEAAAEASAFDALSSQTSAALSRDQAQVSALEALQSKTASAASASAALSSQTAAAMSRDQAAVSALGAANSEAAAALSEDLAQSSALSAQASAEQAEMFALTAVNAPGTTATSLTSNTLDSGPTKTFLIQTGKSLIAGMFLLITAAAAPQNYLIGQVISYNSTTGQLVVSVVKFKGTGTFASWTISLTIAPALGGSGMAIGAQAYLAKTAATPEDHIAFTRRTFFDPTLFPDLAAVVPPTPDEFARQSAAIRRSNPDMANTSFGSAMSISGNYMVVSAKTKTVAGIAGAGVVHIYFYNGTSWILQSTIEAPTPQLDANFGSSVYISGDNLIVGAERYDDPNLDSGIAYIFVRSGASWTLQATLANPTPAAGDAFGWSVCISSNYAIVGAYLDDTTTNNAGSAYIYFKNAGVWTLQASLQHTTPALDLFGSAVAIDENWAVVGAPNRNSGQGSFLVYSRSGTTWTRTQTIGGSGQGRSLHLNGQYLLVGGSNSAIVYFRDTTTFVQQAVVSTSSPGPLPVGYSCFISDKYAVAGSLNGGVAVATRNGTLWTDDVFPILNPRDDQLIGNNFGFAVGVAGETIFVTDPGDDIDGINYGALFEITKTLGNFVVLDPLPASTKHNTLARVA